MIPPRIERPILGITKAEYTRLFNQPEGLGITIRYNHKVYHVRWFLDTNRKSRYFVAERMRRIRSVPLGDVRLFIVDENPFQRKRIPHS
jgi:hypothetical protein